MRRLGERDAWRVVIPEHTIERSTLGGVRLIGPAYEIPASEQTRFEVDEQSAISLAVLDAHVRAGVPPWLPYRRETTARATAVRCHAVAAAGRA